MCAGNCKRLCVAGLLRVRQRQNWISSLEYAKELELGFGDSPKPSREWWKGSKQGLTWPDLEAPQEGSAEADLKVRGKDESLNRPRFPGPSSERPNDSGQLGPSPALGGET